MATETILETIGTVQADGTTVQLDQKLPPGRVKVRVEDVKPKDVVKPKATQAEWDAAMKAVNELEDYDFDAHERQRECDIQDAKEQLSRHEG